MTSCAAKICIKILGRGICSKQAARASAPRSTVFPFPAKPTERVARECNDRAELETTSLCLLIKLNVMKSSLKITACTSRRLARKKLLKNK